MEKNFYNDEFEQLLKEKSDGFRMYPSKRVWHSIYNDLHPGRRWPSIAMGLSLIIVLVIIGYLNNNETNNKQTASTTTATAKNYISTLQHGELNSNSQNNIGNDKNDLLSFNNSLSGLNQLQPGLNNSFSENGTLNYNGSTGFDPYIVAIVNKRNSSNTKRSSHTNNRFTAHTSNSNAVDDNNSANTNAAALNKLSAENSQPVTTAAADYTDNVSTAANNTADLSTTKTMAIPDADNSEKTDLAVNGKGLDTQAAIEKKNLLNASNTRTVGASADKAWIENYAFYNKKSEKSKWKGRTDVAFYVTPNIGYRKLTGGAVYDANPLTAPTVVRGDVGNTVNHTPALGLEAGTAFAYALTKKIQVKAGMQFNYTSYAINAISTYHPVLTSLLMIDPATGKEYTSSRISTLSNENVSGERTKIFNTTYQVSLPVGVAAKLAGNNKVSWYVGGSFQPTYTFGGSANLLSSDRRNYIAESSMIHNWNFNIGTETYLNYKLNGYSLQVGPQFRYQLMSTYDKKYVNSERLYNVGIKVGIVKSL